MSKTIVVIMGESAYQVLNYQTMIMVKEWEKLGYDVHVWDLKEINSENQNTMVSLIIQDIIIPHFFTFSVQALLFDLKYNNRYLSELIVTPYFGWIVDHPIYHLPRIEAAQGSQNAYLLCIDESHLNYLELAYPAVKKILYFPHGGFLAKNTSSYNQKEIDVYSPGGYKDCSLVEQEIDKIPMEKRFIIYDAIQLIMNKSNLSPQEALFESLKNAGESLTSESIRRRNIELNAIDFYVRSLCRETCIRNLVDAGIKVTVCGKGWNDFQCNHPENLVIQGDNGIDITETVEYIAKSKICLNLIPVYTKGLHERIFTAMLNRSVCVTPWNSYISEIFADSETICYFDLLHMEGIVDVVKNLLENDELRNTIAEQAYEVAKEEGTWESRANQLVEMAEILHEGDA